MSGPTGTTSPRGDQRREAILTALDEQLRTRRLDAISVADLTDAAGITRSAFYFYFDSKAAAVTALLASVDSEASASILSLLGDEGTFRERIAAGLVRLADRVAERPHVYRALLAAQATHDGVREMWEAGRLAHSRPIADFIRRERDAGRAQEGADPDTLAVMLIEVNETVLGRLAFAPHTPRDPLLSTAAELWVRAVYGHTDPGIDPVPDSYSTPRGATS